MSPRSVIECIPNFSEGRDTEVIAELRQAIAAAPDVYILDLHSDADHNRTVITFAGSPAGVEEAAFRVIARAADLIDLNHQRGEHPRLGATDVVPFVPVSGVDMDTCVAIAHRLGDRVGTELEIPVYFYENAALHPDRVGLETIRRGEYEGLQEAIQTDPARAPDRGPNRLGPAGATVIGARQFLIAFNVYLTTSDVRIAKKIARAVRHSGGGLRYVKALGLLVEGQAQVSMNLTDFRKTPIFRVVELIRQEAAHYGVAVGRSELVGLLPQQALFDAASWYLQLADFDSQQVLENRLEEAIRASQEVGTPPP